jgi:magnesium chelatase family protein
MCTRAKQAIFVRKANARKAAMIDKTDIYGVQNLRRTFQFLSGKAALLPMLEDLTTFFATQQEYDVDLAEAAGSSLNLEKKARPIRGAAPESSSSIYAHSSTTAKEAAEKRVRAGRQCIAGFFPDDLRLSHDLASLEVLRQGLDRTSLDR